MGGSEGGGGDELMGGGGWRGGTDRGGVEGEGLVLGCVAVRRIVVLFRRVVLIISLSRVPVVASSLSLRGSFVVRWLVLVVGVSRWRWLFSCVVVAVSVCGCPFLFILRRLSSFEGWCSSWGVRRCLSGHVRCWAVVATRRSGVVVGVGRLTAGRHRVTVVGAGVCW